MAMIQLPDRFDDIRPYYDSEVPAAMERMASDPLLEKALAFVPGEVGVGEARAALRSIRTTDELQHRIMAPICHMIEKKTISSLTYDGVEGLDRNRGLLFVSNHRDIVMDAFLQQTIIAEHGMPTSHITFGSNLMNPQFVVDVGLSNKMFKTVRKSADFKAFLESSVHLSDYINHVVAHGESVWIAQRNGRTKDGFDRTDQGLLRMLLIGDGKREALLGLGITPVSVSYQWEPCDILKAAELCRSADGKPYVKAPGEDLHSIVTGITSWKGNVHISMRHILDETLVPRTMRRSDLMQVVSTMDREIIEGYRLWDTNYAAYDLLNDGSRFAGMYSPSLREEFVSRMDSLLDLYPDLDRDMLRNIYLKIYAGPVISRDGLGI